MTYRIVPMAPAYAASFRETLDAVIRESQMYAFFEAPPLERVTEFVLQAMEDDHVQFIAVADDAVVGWCDVLRKSRPAMRHSGVLGVGVLGSHRGQGIGKNLIEATLDAAEERGLTRIELYVRTDNLRAIKLYESFGFSIEGVLRKHVFTGGAYRDSYVMALLTE